jgi:hypothetical protein
MLNYIDWIIKIDQRVYSISAGILKLKFRCNSAFNRLVLSSIPVQLNYITNQLRILSDKSFAALAIARIQNRAICKNNAHRFDGVVAVVQNTVAGATCVIRDDTTNLGRLNRCRFWSQFPSISP